MLGLSAVHITHSQALREVDVSDLAELSKVRLNLLLKQPCSAGRAALSAAAAAAPPMRFREVMKM